MEIVRGVWFRIAHFWVRYLARHLNPRLSEIGILKHLGQSNIRPTRLILMGISASFEYFSLALLSAPICRRSKPLSEIDVL